MLQCLLDPVHHVDIEPNIHGLTSIKLLVIRCHLLATEVKHRGGTLEGANICVLDDLLILGCIKLSGLT